MGRLLAAAKHRFAPVVARRPSLESALQQLQEEMPFGAVDRVEVDADGAWLIDRSGVAWAYSLAAPVGTGFGLEAGHARESDEYALVRLLVPPEGVFVDVGANVGTFSVRLARARPDVSAIVAVEPVPHTCDLLRRNARRNAADIEIFEVALGERPGTVTITTDQGTGNHISSGSGARVPLETLDRVVQQAGLTRLDVLKCDVEGAELAALRGGAETIRRFRPHLIIEIEQRWTARYAYDAAEVFGLLAQLGYDRFERVGGGDLPAEPGWTPADYVAAGGGNFHFRPS